MAISLLASLLSSPTSSGDLFFSLFRSLLVSFSLSWTLWGGTDTLLGHLGVFSVRLRALLARSEELLGTPWTPLGRFGDHVGGSGGLLGRSVELSGSFLGALGRSLGPLGSDFGSIFDICLMDSGFFFGSKARPITKRCLFGSLTKFLRF